MTWKRRLPRFARNDMRGVFFAWFAYFAVEKESVCGAHPTRLRVGKRVVSSRLSVDSLPLRTSASSAVRRLDSCFRRNDRIGLGVHLRFHGLSVASVLSVAKDSGFAPPIRSRAGSARE
jgi:hypothetical protein